MSDGFDSDKDSDDGIRTEVHKLPNSSIHDMHTIVTSEKGSRLLVTPSNRNLDVNRQFSREPASQHHTFGTPDTAVPNTAADTTAEKSISDLEKEFEAATNSFDDALARATGNTPKSSTANNVNTTTTSATPARVTFSTAVADSPDTPLHSMITPDMHANTTVTPGTANSAKHNGFTPMTLQELMKLETPESRVDEMLHELYSLMGYYNRDTPGTAYSSASVNLGTGSDDGADAEEVQAEGGNILFGSPAPHNDSANNAPDVHSTHDTHSVPALHDMHHLSRQSAVVSPLDTLLDTRDAHTPEKLPRDMTDADGLSWHTHSGDSGGGSGGGAAIEPHVLSLDQPTGTFSPPPPLRSAATTGTKCTLSATLFISRLLSSKK